MTNWVKDNRLKSVSMVLGIVISVFVIIGYFGPIDIIAARVYENKKPVMMDALDAAIEKQELRLEPRLQAIEIEQKYMRDDAETMHNETLEMQRQILEEVKK